MTAFGHKPATNGSWLPYACATFCLFGLTNFILAYIADSTAARSSGTSLSAAVLVWCGMGIVGAGGLVLSGFKIPFMAPGQERLVKYPLCAGVLLALGMFSLKMGIAAEPHSSGPIVAITAANSLLVALLARWRLQERITSLQTAAMCVVVGGLVLMSLHGGRAHIMSIVYGLVTMGLFAFTNFLLKYAGFHGMPSLAAGVILWLSAGGLGVGFLAVSLVREDPLHGLSAGLGFLAVLAGVFLAFGMLTIKLAITRGPAGPATAIAGSNAVLVTVLTLVILHKVPPANKLIGMGIVLAGIFLLALKKHRQKHTA